jgi:hypothetical protein
LPAGADDLRKPGLAPGFFVFAGKTHPSKFVLRRLKDCRRMGMKTMDGDTTTDKLRRAGIAVSIFATALAAASLAHAQDGAAASVRLFDRLCYATMPEIANVEAQADSTWQPITGTDLEAFRPAVTPDILKAWKLSAGTATYSLAITKSPMDDQSKADFPKYADATNFACSLTLPADKTPPASVSSEMQKLIERKPDAAFVDGPWAITSWSGGNDRLLVLVYHYAPKSGSPGGLISMTVFQKP